MFAVANPIKARSKNQHYVKRDGSPCIMGYHHNGPLQRSSLQECDNRAKNKFYLHQQQWQSGEYPNSLLIGGGAKPRPQLNTAAERTRPKQTLKLIYAENKSFSKIASTLSQNSSMHSCEDMPHSLNQTLLQHELSDKKKTSTLKLNP